MPSPEIQELEIKISLWDLLNDCEAHLQAVVVERLPSNDFECLTSAVCRRGEFARNSLGEQEDWHGVLVSRRSTKAKSQSASQL